MLGRVLFLRVFNTRVLDGYDERSGSIETTKESVEEEEVAQVFMSSEGQYQSGYSTVV
jgi:hypothetical protein